MFFYIPYCERELLTFCEINCTALQERKNEEKSQCNQYMKKEKQLEFEKHNSIIKSMIKIGRVCFSGKNQHLFMH